MTRSAGGISKGVGWDGFRTGLWMRVFDVPSTLEARSDATEGAVTFEVIDPLLPTATGRYRLTVTDGHASCERRVEHPDTTMTINALAMMYFGATSAFSLAAAGYLEAESVATLAGLDAMFAVKDAPNRLLWL